MRGTHMLTTLLLVAPVATPLSVSAGHALRARRADIRVRIPAARTAPADVLVPVGAGGPAEAVPLDTHPPEPPSPTRSRGWAGLVSPAAMLACGAALAAQVPYTGPVSAFGEVLRADALTVWMLLVVGAVAALAVAAGPAHLAGERAAGRAADRTVHRYHLLVHAFLAAMAWRYSPGTSACCGWRWRRPRWSPRSSSATAAPVPPSRRPGSTW